MRAKKNLRSNGKKRREIDETINNNFKCRERPHNATGKSKGGIIKHGEIISITIRCQACGAVHRIKDSADRARQMAREYRRDHFKHKCSKAYKV